MGIYIVFYVLGWVYNIVLASALTAAVYFAFSGPRTPRIGALVFLALFAGSVGHRYHSW